MTSLTGAPVQHLKPAADTNAPPNGTQISTILAARLQSRISNDNVTKSRADRESLQQLLHILLNDERETQLDQETPLDETHRLIWVIAEAGLQGADDGSTSALEATLQTQALDTLEVIRVVVQRRPQLLFNVSNWAQQSRGISSVPLFVWLLPKIISASAIWSKSSVVCEKAFEVVSAVVKSRPKCLQPSQECFTTANFLLGILADLLALLDSWLASPEIESRQLCLGSPHFFKSFLRSYGLPDSCFEAEFPLGNLQHATTVAIRLLSISAAQIRSPSLGSSSMTPARRIFHDVCRLYRKLWRLVLPLCKKDRSTDLLSEFLISGLTLCCFFPSNSSSHNLARQFQSFWSQCWDELLDAAVSTDDETTHENVITVLYRGLGQRPEGLIASAFLKDVISDRLGCLRGQTSDASLLFLGILQELKKRSADLPTNGSGQSLTQPNTDVDFPEERPAKRIRLSSQMTSTSSHDRKLLCGQINRILRSRDDDLLEGLNEKAADTYTELSPEQQSDVLTRLGQTACADAGTLVESPLGHESEFEIYCTVCDAGVLNVSPRKTCAQATSSELLQTLSNVLPSVQKSPQQRILAMLSLRRLLLHSEVHKWLTFGPGSLMEWCLNCLRSSLRELRITAGRTLTAFLHGDLPSEICKTNCYIGLEFMHSRFDKDEPSLQETYILALSAIAQVSEDEEMNIILDRFLNYLGHANPYIVGVVFNELQKLGKLAKETPLGLLRPFWRTLAITAVNSLQRRPQIAQQLSDFLNLGIDEWLMLTEVYVLPHLVLAGKADLIAKMAARRELSTFALCTNKENLAAILAFLLALPSSDPATTILRTLGNICEEFSTSNLSELARIEPILTACNLLKSAAEAGDGQANKYYQALHLLATFQVRKSISAATTRKTDVLGFFIESNVLGIVVQLVDTIVLIAKPNSEKRLCIMAIGEMIKVGKKHIGSALPQICACLRSAFDNDELRGSAFTVWSVLIVNLPAEEVSPLVDQTLAIVIRYWARFQDDTRQRARHLLEHIRNSESLEIDPEAMPSLASIPELADLELSFEALRDRSDIGFQIYRFVGRCQTESEIVVHQALTELSQFLKDHDSFLHRAALTEQPEPVVAELLRTLLDCCVRFSSSVQIQSLAAQCIGRIGCLDSNRIETVREKNEILVLSNFMRKDETIDFIIFFLHHVLVDAFLSAPNMRAQGFLAWAMQELLKRCDINSAGTHRLRNTQGEPSYKRWEELPEITRNTLTPFFSSNYTVKAGNYSARCSYPIFAPATSHGEWLRTLVLDLLQRGTDNNIKQIFSVCSRIIRYQDIAISQFLLPFAVLNLVVSTAVQADENQKQACEQLKEELLLILKYPLPHDDRQLRESILLCSESIFQVFDYLTKWHQAKRKDLASSRAIRDSMVIEASAVGQLLASIPAEIMSQRAVECKSYARALLHWEQHIRQGREEKLMHPSHNLEPMYERLQDIYTQIDEPDGIEGISAHLHILNIDQQVLEHRKAGRWTAAQSWYELVLIEQPHNISAQVNLLSCLKESGQYDALLNQFEGLSKTTSSIQQVLPYAVEASWVTGRLEKLEGYLNLKGPRTQGDFNLAVGSCLGALRHNNPDQAIEIVAGLRRHLAKDLTSTNTASFKACHETRLRLHVLEEIECLIPSRDRTPKQRSKIIDSLDRRLEVLGGYVSDKQYILGIRRSVMKLSSYSDAEVASSWLTTARMGRKGDSIGYAFNAVVRAAQLGDKSATIENARLMWQEGDHRKAIQCLEGAIAAQTFQATTKTSDETDKQLSMLTARAHLLLAKWLDKAGQTQSEIIIKRYNEAIGIHKKWEKAYYHLGKHFIRMLESEKAKQPGKESQAYLSGQIHRAVADNFFYCLLYGNKYVYQALPKALTLYLEFVSEADRLPSNKIGNKEFQAAVLDQRKKNAGRLHSRMRKYGEQLQPAVLYTVLPQVVARICHKDATVESVLKQIIVRTVTSFPQQALWTLLAIAKSSNKDRANHGNDALNRLPIYTQKLNPKLGPQDFTAANLTLMIAEGRKLTDGLLQVCEVDINSRSSTVSLTRDLRFNIKTAPSRLVIPIESTLTPSLSLVATGSNSRAFPKDAITIAGFLDDVLVLKSLQKPRRVSVRGSDGRVYGLLCKPKDDLRKDQRLMEFDAMINRLLKKDVESSKRQLYIRTYAVTPLNEECGLIEWVNGLKTYRDLMVKYYTENRGVSFDYNAYRRHLNDNGDITSKVEYFEKKLLPAFSPIFHEWFVDTFPGPEAWFAARLRYTRSCAVMSIVGYVLGLGDRHTENILLEEDTGGVFHVDFNCLFDKGLTFEKPELVPFRLTHNMIDAFGVYGYNGPYRKSCEITLGLLRSNEDSLMTILETFLYDPTTDFIGGKSRSNRHAAFNVPDTPEGVLESVRSKLRGLLAGESMSLNVSGQVDHLILQATKSENLAVMYIGWMQWL